MEIKLLTELLIHYDELNFIIQEIRKMLRRNTISQHEYFLCTSPENVTDPASVIYFLPEVLYHYSFMHEIPCIAFTINFKHTLK